MRIGTLRHRVTLQEYVKGKDAYGGMTQEWVINDNITSAETVVTMMFNSMPEALRRIYFS